MKQLGLMMETIVVTATLVMKLASFFVICFCSLFLLFFGLDRAQNTTGIETQINNLSSLVKRTVCTVTVCST